MPVPGLTGIHELGPGGPRLGDLTLWPRYRVVDIPGFRGLGDLEDQRDLPAGRNREIPRKAVRRGKTFTYQGVVEARNQDELNQAVDTLVAACAPTDELLISITPKRVAEGSFTFMGQPTALDPPESLPDVTALGRPTYGYERTFALGIRMSDPRFIGPTQPVVQTAGITNIGGTPLPWVLPIPIAAPGSSSGAATVTYAGTAPGDPVFNLYGPSTNPGIRSDTVNKELRWTLSLTVNDFLVVDFRDRSVLLNGTEDVSYLIDRGRSNWWDGDVGGLVAGTNSLVYVGDSLQDPAHANIVYAYYFWS